jgi:putative DNA methylase
MAVVAEGARGRVYVAPTPEIEAAANRAEPEWRPDADIGGDRRALWTPLYGLDTFGDLFTDRQLVALNTFSDLVGKSREKARADAVAAGMSDDGVGIADGGAGAQAYADAVATYLAFAVDRLANRSSTICFWDNGYQKIQQTFGRQARPMTWDFAEGNPFSDSSGSFKSEVSWIPKFLRNIPGDREAIAMQADARTDPASSFRAVLATDPPYYDNIGYADLSDYFYIWMRRSLREIYPELFGTMLVPKQSELVATPYRFNGSKEQARSFFEYGLSQTFDRLRQVQLPGFPMTVYYAFKQEDIRHDDGGRVSTGWETMLQALIDKGFQIVGTWPVRTEYTGNLKKTVNALASSIVLVCRDRAETAGVTTRAELISELRAALGEAIPELQAANTPPVDIDQSAIGPGMAVYSKYSRVMEGQGTMSVRSALSLINQLIEEVLTGSDADYDSYTRWGIKWFEEYGFAEGEFGRAETLSKAKDVSVSGLVDAGFLYSRAGKVRILRRDELDSDWDPATDTRLTVWEVTHHMMRRLESDGEKSAAEVMAAVGSRADAAKELCYRLYSICERKGWAQEALGYNMLISSWPEISRLAAEQPKSSDQTELDLGV